MIQAPIRDNDPKSDCFGITRTHIDVPETRKAKTIKSAQQSKPQKNNCYFTTEDLRENLAKKTARGGVYTLAATAINFLVTVTSTILVTRKLTDEDFGLVAMVTVLTGFASIFLDLGLSKAVIQKPKINHDQVSTLFWINIAVASIIATIVAAATPLLIWVYNEPRLLPINLALSSLFIVSALGIQHRALLARRMEHGKISLVAILATPIAAAVAITIAYLGGKYWALVAIPAVSQLAIVIGMWIACPWIPGRPKRGTGVREMLGFGSQVTGFQFVNYFARRADNALLGYQFGAGPLGLYDRAYSLMLMPARKLNGPIVNVVVPALSRLCEDPVKYRKAFLACLTPISYFQTLLVGFTLLNIENLVILFLGENWVKIVPVFYALSLAAVAAGTNGVGGWLYLSYGHVDAQLKWSLFQSSVMLLGLAIGVQFGTIGTALAVSIVYTLSKPLAIIYSSRPTPIAARDILICVYKPVGIALIALAMTMTVILFYEPNNPWLQILVRSSLYGGFVLLLIAAIPWLRKDITEAIKNIRLLR